MGHTGWVRPEVAQDLPEYAGVRIDVLVVGNDLKRPDRVRGHVPPIGRATARGHRIHATTKTACDWRTVHSLNRSPGVAPQPNGNCTYCARLAGPLPPNVGLSVGQREDSGYPVAGNRSDRWRRDSLLRIQPTGTLPPGRGSLGDGSHSSLR